jgi:hypothetical protein
MATKTSARAGSNKSAIKIPADPRRIAPSAKNNTKELYEYRLSTGGGAVFLMRNTTYDYYDEEQNAVRHVRYCQSERSIFADEQSENPVRTPLTFRMGVLIVPKTKPNLIEFMSKHPGNIANGGRDFYLVDYVAQKSVDLDSEFLVADAITMLKTKPVEELLMIATAYGMNTDREFAEIKHDLLQKAKANPEAFMKSFDDPAMKMRSKIKAAANYQIISLDVDAVRWFDTGQQIISVPAGMDPTDVFVRYCLTEKAAPIVEEIEKQLQ